MSCFVIEESSLPLLPHTETIRLPISLDILASQNVAQRQRNKVRLLVDGDEIGINSYRYTKDRNSAGTSCTFSLTNYAERTLLTNSAVITFQISTDGGATWDTKAENQKVSSRRTVIDSSRQVFVFDTIDSGAAKLNKAPSETYVMYDSAKSPFNPDDVEIRYDTAGNEYGVESDDVPGLTLEDVLDEIIVTRCGFSGYFTNLPLDIPVKAAYFELAVPYWEGLKVLFGQYGAIVEIIDDIFYLYDSTLALSESAPAPRDLTVLGCSNLSINTTETNADCVRLSFTGNEYDYIVNRPKVFTDNYTEEETGDFIQVNVIQNYHHYISRLHPDVTQKKELQAELRDATRSPGLIHEYLKTFSKEFDSFGRCVRTTYLTGERVPDLANAGEYIFKETAHTETEDYEYAQHPYDVRRQFLKSVTKQTVGLKVLDTDEPYDWDTEDGAASIAYREAHRGRWLRTGNTYAENKVLFRSKESFTPLRNGMTDYRKEHYDAVARVAAGNDKNQPRTGDVGLNGQFGTPQELFVLETEESTKGVGTYIDLAVGDLPLKYAIPLARRILYKAKYAPASADFEIIGIDDAVRKGATVTAKDKDDNNLGYYLIEGYSGQGAVTQSGSSLSFTHTMSVQASQIPSNVPDSAIDSYSLSVPSSDALTITREIECFDGYEFSSEVVSDLTVEARISGAWTNIETSPIDLSPYAGTTQTFEIRFTASATAVNLHKDFDLIIQPNA